jgi:gliding motility-associated-like protein
MLFYFFLMKIFLFLISLIAFQNKATCQNQNNIWYFGDFAGLDFNTTPSTPLLNGALKNDEAVSSVSDLKGDILFYSNGIKIWNKEHNLMENGEGLLGTSSSSQMLIVPKPGNCNIFYVFTTPTENDEVPLCYSIVDMLANNKLGSVISKNNVIKNSVTERITGTLKSNGNDYWIVFQERGTNAFYTYSLTSSGLSNTPIISFAGEIHVNFSDAIGYLKISNNGKKIVSTCEIGHKKSELFDFDNATGIISNPITLSTDGAYGAEFSDDNKKLYLSSYSTFKLSQFDISSNNTTTIINSKIILADEINTEERGGALQRGPDNKIYIARSLKSFLGVINNPNQAGLLCQYVPNGINLNGRKSNAGLPNNINKFSQSTCGTLSAKYFKTGCNLYNIVAKASFGLGPYRFSLDGITFQNSNIFPNNISDSFTITAKDALGVTKIFPLKIIKIGYPEINILKTTLPNCGKKDGSVTLTSKAGKPPYTYSKDGISFQADSTFYDIGIETNTFFVKDNEGCIDDTIKTLINVKNEKVFAGNDTLIFISQPFLLAAKDISNTGFNNFSWSPSIGLTNANAATTNAIIEKETEFTVFATNTLNGCKAEDKITIKVAKDANIYVPTAFTPNADRRNDILKAKPIGITDFKYFTLYNRYGQLLFSTKDALIGWDGKVNGIEQNTGTYVWIAEGVDYTGKNLKRQGLVSLIR